MPSIGINDSSIKSTRREEQVSHKTYKNVSTYPFGVNHPQLPIHALNAGSVELMDAHMPLPFSSNLSPSAFPLPIRHYGDAEVADEPRYDPSLHLAPQNPESVVLLPDFRTAEADTVQMQNSASQLAFTKTFQLFSEEGTRVLHNIILREKHRAHKNHRNEELRGLYYLSPFVRDVMTCPVLLAHLEKFTGEPVVPHFLSMNSPAVNFGKAPARQGSTTDSDAADQKVVDHWHFDSVAYVGVALVSDTAEMVGGDLQVMKKEKFAAVDMLNTQAEGTKIPEDVLVTVKYEKPGYCILVQGSEILHHVTRVEKAKEDRLSFIMAFQPANCFRPDKTVLDTWKRFDAVDKTAPYEYARLKAHKLSHALSHYVKNQPFSADGGVLSEKLKAVRDELTRTIDLLEEHVDDKIGYFDEVAVKYVI